MEHQTFDPALPHWADLHVQCSGLLLGNGASRAIWRNFAYESLFERAQRVRNKPLGQTDLALFKSMGTESFEQVLSALNTTVRVNAALAISSSSPLNRYYAIKEALIHALRGVHIPWRLVQAQTLQAINQALRQYPRVYSSNYDLLCHWAVQHQPEGFADLLRGDEGFSSADIPAQGIRLHYLHGGLHLLKNQDASTRQRSASASHLLDGFAINTPGDVPLFVNESNSADKLRVIRGSDYLSWCLGQLSGHQGPLCIFGHSLETADQHIVEAIRQSGATHLAISIFPLSEASIISQKQHYSRLFAAEGVTLSFFDSTTHPLGASALDVPVPLPAPTKRRR